ncbi:MAG: HaeIII family restriction endonuclease [Muribaculaceae bacterium]|nr:HaeIII family restriction endonuclease [Muribaculaceae bacterium]
MSSKSNDQGRAYEYACLKNLETQISKIRPCVLVENSSFNAAQRAWITLSAENKLTYVISSLAAVEQIFAMEPRITEHSDDPVELLLQADQNGEAGDVRDILIIRQEINWEIGLSLKHNHFAVKHSRLSSRLDFGKSWYSIPCSETYWNAVNPVFKYLSEEKLSGRKFADLPDKESDVYIPILKAFIDEISLQSKLHHEVPSRMVEYLLGKFDFYKIISIDKEELTRVQGYNMHGTLNQPSNSRQAEIEVPIVSLPTRIVHIGFVPDKNNTVEIYMDGGWQFSFRIHNAATYVEPSLKFDIQIVGMPAAILTINCIWKY